ncbi:MAG: hypothetical protein A2070_08785 [Bdellovibrionales bacterium GWC1_52_8]|nr:MAG: hypothetical protein A2Z97_01220 [Bdellovibrionales bacterium GWB1_52_6]OFZ06466.1 MAG: hypothetical protein A2X97_16720 [Bdellovibrionales bacterium GWA1_52_35]OFZ37265.1 MAG: hypothetical protein A2070_08785 [Bdellovibrionales bacterium GWC1_52_8]
MHIALFHEAVIPPQKYGGTERAIYWLAKALALKGHQVTLLAKPGSAVPGVRVMALPPKELRPASGSLDSLIPQECDLVHLFGTPSVLPKKPFLVTIEGNGQPGEKFHPNTVFVSRKHAEIHGSSHYVYNGLDPDDFPCDVERDDYLVFLAKASWSVKNLAGAIQIAKAAGIPLKIMGSRNWPLNLHRLRPAWGGIEYCGMLGDHEKRKILRKARGLLFPVVWHEPFGVALTEALASGCPVFSTPYGSIPEIVSSDVGFLSNQASEHVEALKNARFSPAQCRERVNQGFTHFQMAEKYLAYYQQILNDGQLSSEIPETIPYQIPLAWHPLQD